MANIPRFSQCTLFLNRHNSTLGDAKTAAGPAKKAKKKKKDKKSKRDKDGDGDKDETKVDETAAVQLRPRLGPSKPPRTHSVDSAILQSSPYSSRQHSARSDSIDEDPDDGGVRHQAAADVGAAAPAEAAAAAATSAQVRDDQEASVAEDQPGVGARHEPAAAVAHAVVVEEKEAERDVRELGARPKVKTEKQKKRKKSSKDKGPPPEMTLTKEESTDAPKVATPPPATDDMNAEKKAGDVAKLEADDEVPSEPAPRNPLAQKKKTETTTRNPLAKKKNDSEVRNPLARKRPDREDALPTNPITAAKKNSSEENKPATSRRGSEPADAAAAGLPNFRMAAKATVGRQASTAGKKGKKRTGEKKTKMIVGMDGSTEFVEESSSPPPSSSEDEGNKKAPLGKQDSLMSLGDDIDLDFEEDHLEIFSLNPDVEVIKKKILTRRKMLERRKQQKTGAVPKMNPAAVHGLTPEEEKLLEAAMAKAEERKRQREEELKEKVRKAEAEREEKKEMMAKKVEKTRRVSIEKDLRAAANKGEEKAADGEKTEFIRQRVITLSWFVEISG